MDMKDDSRSPRPPCSTPAAHAAGKVATAESCTGGLVAGALTEIAGSSDVVDRGFVTYSNAAKQQMLGVPAATLERLSARSAAQTAEAMARGALGDVERRSGGGDHRHRRPGGGIARQAGRAGAFRRRVARRRPRSMPKCAMAISGASEVRHKSVLQALAMLKELAEQ